MKVTTTVHVALSKTGGIGAYQRMPLEASAVRGLRRLPGFRQIKSTARNAQCVVTGVACYMPQRRVDRGDVFFADIDRGLYLFLAIDRLREAEVLVLVWCSMTNHVHWVGASGKFDSLLILFRRVHRRCAQHLNEGVRRSEHLWQNHFYSCAVAEERGPPALRCREQNSLRAGATGV